MAHPDKSVDALVKKLDIDRFVAACAHKDARINHTANAKDQSING